MKKILFVGEHPFATSGNSGMLHSLLSQIRTSEYDVSCFVQHSPFIDNLPLMFRPLPFAMMVNIPGSDITGQLLHIIDKSDVDAIVVVGLDIWYFGAAGLKELVKMSIQRNTRLVFIMPYDLQEVREDWVEWINTIDYPCIYSKYGEQMLKPHVPGVRYFRPQLHLNDIWKPFSEQDRAVNRKRIFPTVMDQELLFAFIGPNQFRKDPQGLIKAFSIAKETVPDIRLFMHTDFKKGIFNLSQYAKDCGLQENDVLKKPASSAAYKIGDMPTLYNCFDVLMNCTFQEGLSWTPLEAMLCGVPVIVSDTTAHPELVKGAGLLVPCEEPAALPVPAQFGNSFVDAKKCKPEDIAEAMVRVAQDETLRSDMAYKGIKRGKEWLAGASDINELLEEVCSTGQPIHAPVELSLKKAVLFVQHSAAGDVLMTTRCLKGIKERYDMPLHYMTSPQYEDIITNNPHIDEFVPWDNDALSKYAAVINPHGERIAPGHWGRNSNSLLSDFYWKILSVEPDDFFIEQVQPERIKKDGNAFVFFEENEKGVLLPHLRSPAPICLVHTTGGDPAFRTYKFMKDVVAGVRNWNYVTVQMGGKSDFPAWADVDLRGKLTFRESAWVVARARIAVTVDSFMSHLCGAFGVPQVCLFGSGNANVVKPVQVKGELVCMSPDYVYECPGLGPCSASKRDCYAPCTGRHDPKEVLKHLRLISINA